MTDDPQYPRIETTERGYREFLRTHPRRKHLRREDCKGTSYPATIIYDKERYDADQAYAKAPTRFAVATRSFDTRTNEWVFHILPNGTKQGW